jgi:hypothetical protein
VFGWAGLRRGSLSKAFVAHGLGGGCLSLVSSGLVVDADAPRVRLGRGAGALAGDEDEDEDDDEEEEYCMGGTARERDASCG